MNRLMGLTKNEAMDLQKVTISVISAKAGICHGLRIINKKSLPEWRGSRMRGNDGLNRRKA